MGKVEPSNTKFHQFTVIVTISSSGVTVFQVKSFPLPVTCEKTFLGNSKWTEFHLRDEYLF